MRVIDLERQLKVLANRRRLSIVSMLRRRKEMGVGAIADVLRLSLTATSRHLSMLERAGFLEKEQRSLQVYYRIAESSPDTYKALSTLF
ncbi:winged helix-turn-helix transcriptional regulator [Candidatus Kaiserbacteria bacterium]|nr:winged helix-turn-helix transcriptional regulator [Candidatus Kaiserbacteria bacterium]